MNIISPIVFKLPNNFLNYKELDNDDVLLSQMIPYPLFTLGFHSFVNRTRSALDITKNINTKTEFYYVVNPFENKISDYEDDIINSNKIYLKTDKVYSNDFNKFWEVLFVFDIIQQSSTIQIIDGDEIEECIDLFQKKTSKNTFKNTFVTEKNVKKNSCNLIISHYKKSVSDENFIEQESYVEFINSIINILKNLADGGNVVLQYYDTFTLPSIKLIYIIQSFFENSYVYKPFLSRYSDSSRYLILKNYKSTKSDVVINKLEKCLKKIDDKNYPSDIFPDLVLSKDFLSYMKFINIKLINNQQIMINDIVKYIKENNYYSEKYHNYREKQIESTKWWVTNFYPPSVNLYDKNKEELDKIYKNAQSKFVLEYQKFNEMLV